MLNIISILNDTDRVREGTGGVGLCAYVEHSILNSTIEKELSDQRAEDRAKATSSAQLWLCPCESLHSKGSDKIYNYEKLFWEQKCQYCKCMHNGSW